MPSIFKRTRNLMRASVANNDTIAPSIRSVVEMREHLSQKHADLLVERQRTANKIFDYQNLISRWSIRVERAESAIKFSSTLTQKHESHQSVDEQDCEKSQEIIKEFSSLLETARGYLSIYMVALENNQARQVQQDETDRKMIDTLYRLQSFERKLSLIHI